MKTNNTKKIAYFASVTVVGLLVGVSLQFVRAWIPPTPPAPGNNVEAPLSTGTQPQIKYGALQVTGFRNLGNTQLDGNVTVNGSVTANSDAGITFADGSVQTTALEKNVPASLCIAPNAATGLCEDNFYIKGTNKCCPFNTEVSTLPGTWYPITEVGFYVTQADPDNYWSAVTDKKFTAAKTVSAVKVYGSANDGGYCYAYWGTGHVETWRHDPSLGIYTGDNQVYPMQSPLSGGSCAQYSVDGDGYAYCSSYNPTYCEAGAYPISNYYTCDSDGNCSNGPGCEKPCPEISFSNDGVAKLCQINWNAGGMGANQKVGLDIPAGTEIHLQGAHTIGIKSDEISCQMEVQYK